jgi:predicted amidophosphoribosyltransferase
MPSGRLRKYPGDGTYYKNRRAALMAENRCLACGNLNKEDGTCDCQRQRYHRLKGEGKCTQCGLPKESNAVRCEACLMAHRERAWARGSKAR